MSVGLVALSSGSGCDQDLSENQSVTQMPVPVTQAALVCGQSVPLLASSLCARTCYGAECPADCLEEGQTVTFMALENETWQLGNDVTAYTLTSATDQVVTAAVSNNRLAVTCDGSEEAFAAASQQQESVDLEALENGDISDAELTGWRCHGCGGRVYRRGWGRPYYRPYRYYNTWRPRFGKPYWGGRPGWG
jgi:hypothetical protein